MDSKHAKLPLWANKNNDEKLDTLKDMLLDLYVYTLKATRNNLLVILKKHQSSDEKERTDVEKIISLIETHPNIMSKNCEIGHITGSALIVNTSSAAILLHYHKKLSRWLQFGGHAEYETDVSEVAWREAHEETGLLDLRFYPEIGDPKPLDIDIHTIPERKGEPEHLHLDFRYLLFTDNPSSLSVSSAESNQFRWVPFDAINEIRTEVDDSLWRMILKAKQIYSAL